MIVIGSTAALLGGFMPPWRTREPKDVDLVVQAGEVAQLEKELRFTAFPVTPSTSVIMTDRIDFELMLLPPPVIRQMEALCPPPAALELGGVRIDARLAPVEVIWATLADTAGCNRAGWEKSFRDLAWYQSLATPTEAHFALARALRAEMVRRITTRLQQE